MYQTTGKIPACIQSVPLLPAAAPKGRLRLRKGGRGLRLARTHFGGDGGKSMRKTESQKIALCGVLGALSVVLLLVGSALQVGTYAAPMFAAFLLVPVLEEYGVKYAALQYITVSLLALLLVPETELAFFYVLVMGHYPILCRLLARVRPPALRWAVKFLALNAATVLMYAVLFALFGTAALSGILSEGTPVLAAMLAAGNLSFWLCDRALYSITLYYKKVLRNKLKRKL